MNMFAAGLLAFLAMILLSDDKEMFGKCFDKLQGFHNHPQSTCSITDDNNTGSSTRQDQIDRRQKKVCTQAVGTIFKQIRSSHVSRAIENDPDCDDSDDEGAVNQNDQFSDSSASGNEEQDGSRQAREVDSVREQEPNSEDAAGLGQQTQGGLSTEASTGAALKPACDARVGGVSERGREADSGQPGSKSQREPEAGPGQQIQGGLSTGATLEHAERVCLGTGSVMMEDSTLINPPAEFFQDLSKHHHGMQHWIAGIDRMVKQGLGNVLQKLKSMEQMLNERVTSAQKETRELRQRLELQESKERVKMKAIQNLNQRQGATEQKICDQTAVNNDLSNKIETNLEKINNLSQRQQTIHYNWYTFENQITTRVQASEQTLQSSLQTAERTIRDEVTSKLQASEQTLQSSLQTAERTIRDEVTSKLQASEQTLQSSLQTAERTIRDEVTSKLQASEQTLQSSLQTAERTIRDEVTSKLQASEQTLQSSLQTAERTIRDEVTSKLQASEQTLQSSLQTAERTIRDEVTSKLQTSEQTLQSSLQTAERTIRDEVTSKLQASEQTLQSSLQTAERTIRDEVTSKLQTSEQTLQSSLQTAERTIRDEVTSKLQASEQTLQSSLQTAERTIRDEVTSKLQASEQTLQSSLQTAERTIRDEVTSKLQTSEQTLQSSLQTAERTTQNEVTSKLQASRQTLQSSLESVFKNFFQTVFSSQKASSESMSEHSLQRSVQHLVRIAFEQVQTAILNQESEQSFVLQSGFSSVLQTDESNRYGHGRDISGDGDALHDGGEGSSRDRPHLGREQGQSLGEPPSPVASDQRQAPSVARPLREIPSSTPAVNVNGASTEAAVPAGAEVQTAAAAFLSTPAGSGQEGGDRSTRSASPSTLDPSRPASQPVVAEVASSPPVGGEALRRSAPVEQREGHSEHGSTRGHEDTQHRRRRGRPRKIQTESNDTTAAMNRVDPSRVSSKAINRDNENNRHRDLAEEGDISGDGDALHDGGEGSSRDRPHLGREQGQSSGEPQSPVASDQRQAPSVARPLREIPSSTATDMNLDTRVKRRRIDGHGRLNGSMNFKKKQSSVVREESCSKAFVDELSNEEVVMYLLECFVRAKKKRRTVDHFYNHSWSPNLEQVWKTRFKDTHPREMNCKFVSGSVVGVLYQEEWREGKGEWYIGRKIRSDWNHFQAIFTDCEVETFNLAEESTILENAPRNEQKGQFFDVYRDDKVATLLPFVSEIREFLIDSFVLKEIHESE
ncbi:hypothetical protein GUITHDRAFT_107010 [Guillardia theta CCMP2712]|uniref:Uncharacterized protein n=1 Tax=Guillardia theta (strain CCMP2712) TaxID=905079 RepID=L1JEX8_GUITC|nr:hypothetical protein GUITHDRAFT_107010 [Guillardia theta CCMP2712]EKX47098.1 hypothetical protein GUITHDRAFT_107010 [Guillardia theta CCMP2712]|eukprot:XP_005834078.1 hypothetical protein GUITHDRAFT_107010 [Guillardia theta CCMP2712]